MSEVCVYVKCVCVRVRVREREREMETEAEGRRRAGGRGVLERGQRCSAGSNVTEETTGAYTHSAHKHTPLLHQ